MQIRLSGLLRWCSLINISLGVRKIQIDWAGLFFNINKSPCVFTTVLAPFCVWLSLWQMNVGPSTEGWILWEWESLGALLWKNPLVKPSLISLAGCLCCYDKWPTGLKRNLHVLFILSLSSMKNRILNQEAEDRDVALGIVLWLILREFQVSPSLWGLWMALASHQSPLL